MRRITRRRVAWDATTSAAGAPLLPSARASGATASTADAPALPSGFLRLEISVSRFDDISLKTSSKPRR
eukprot:1086160-Pyramimonas_sp.AAC.1